MYHNDKSGWITGKVIQSDLVCGGEHWEGYKQGERTAHAAEPRTKWMKNGILGTRSKAGGRFATQCAF